MPKGSQASEGTPTAVQVTYPSGDGDRNSWLLRVPEAVRLDSAQLGDRHRIFHKTLPRTEGSSGRGLAKMLG